MELSKNAPNSCKNQILFSFDGKYVCTFSNYCKYKSCKFFNLEYYKKIEKELEKREKYDNYIRRVMHKPCYEVEAY
jgi:hypothetical protein